MTARQAAEPVAVSIDGRTVEVPPGTLVVEAARRAGVHIPVFCYHPRLKPAGVCRMCLVKVEGQPKLVTACTTTVAPGMQVQTRDPLVQQAQRSVVEFLLLNHPLDCPVCDKGGECDLQDLTLRYGPGMSRLVDPKVRRPKAVQLGPFIVLDRERCILCRRCVRFDDEVAQEGQLVIEQRAIACEVTTAGGQPYEHLFTGNTIELCPVGALTSALYRFRARPWDLSSVASRCSLCSVHCPVRMDFRLGQLVRVVSPGAEGLLPFGAPGLMEAYHTPAEDVPGGRGMGWLCDRGRFNYRYVHSPQRLSRPLRGRGDGKEAVEWEPALEEIVRAIAAAVREEGPGSVAIVGGGRLMAEEAFLLRELADRIGTPHRDHRVGGQALASLATPGGVSGRREDLQEAQTVLLVGTPPLELAPVLDLEIRAAVARGARLVAVGLRRPAYRGGVEHHLAWGPEVATALRALTPALQEGEGRVAVVWDGDGAWDGRAREVGEALLELAARLEAQGRPASILIPGGQPQSRAAEAAGLLPGPGGFDTRRILQAAADGRLRVLYLVGANLLATFPDARLVERALERTPLVVVQDLFLTATARRADWVLPVLPAPMRAGTLVDLDGAVDFVEAAMPSDGAAPGDLAVLARLLDGVSRWLDGRDGVDWWSAAGERELVSRVQERWPSLQAAMGARLPALTPEQARSIWAYPAAARGPAGSVEPVPAARSDGRPAGGASQGLRVARVERALEGGGTLAFDPWLSPLRPGPWVLVNPEDARALDVREGEAVEVRTAHGSAVAPVKVDPGLPPGWLGVAGASEPACAGRLVRWDDPYPAAEIRVAAAREVAR